MHRFHPMPFGYEKTAQGTTFRLWAPNAKKVILEHCSGPFGLFPMTHGKEGWFEISLPQLTVGHLYQFRVDGRVVPDPVSRFQPFGVHGPSEIIDPLEWPWKDQAWRGRHWQEAIIYELHVGSFSQRGLYQDVEAQLDYLVDLGVTAIELMPIAECSGRRNWGYDGVLWFAPYHCYGRPEELKSLIDASHQRGLMVLLDVVYNHMGPVGNYQSLYAKRFFNEKISTPWGKGINFKNKWVMETVFHSILYWIEEYHFDGLRFDAVQYIKHEKDENVFQEILDRVKAKLSVDRSVHFILENDDNNAEYLREDKHGKVRVSQWNDDFHHSCHVACTNETYGYYQDYVENPLDHLGRSLTEGFSYQGQYSRYRQRCRGTPCTNLDLSSFVHFLQNHDQIGNRLDGLRIHFLCGVEKLKLLTEILLLAPPIPLLLMGQEWLANEIFPFFCDFEQPLAKRIAENRLKELSKLTHASKARARGQIPDPNIPDTYLSSKLNHKNLDEQQARFLDYVKQRISLRKRFIIPVTKNEKLTRADYKLKHKNLLQVAWNYDRTDLCLFANFSEESKKLPAIKWDRLIMPDNIPENSTLDSWKICLGTVQK